MNEKRVLKLSICNKVYTVATDESEEQINKAAKLVDQLFRDIASKTQFKNEGKVAMLTALHIAFNLTKTKEHEEELAIKLKNMVSTIDSELQ